MNHAHRRALAPLLLAILPPPLFLAAGCTQADPDCVRYVSGRGLSTADAESFCGECEANGFCPEPTARALAVTAQPGSDDRCAAVAADDRCLACTKASCCSETVLCGSAGDCSALGACLSANCTAECPGAQ